MRRAILVVVLACAGCCASAAAPDPVPDDFSLRLARGSCEGACPIYSVRVDRQGRVHWNGERFVHRKGTASKRIATAQLQALVRRADELRILSLPPGTHPCIDLPLVTVELTVNGRSISVAHCRMSNASPDARRLLEFAEFIDRTLAIDAWIGGIEDRRMR